MQRYYVLFKGRVQGVGFRYTLIMTANKYHITGYCKNLLNGNVEAEIQGEKIDAFLKDIFEPKHFIDIEDYALKQLPLVDNETDFTVRY